jgi:WD40 repeat protein
MRQCASGIEGDVRLGGLFMTRMTFRRAMTWAFLSVALTPIAATSAKAQPPKNAAVCDVCRILGKNERLIHAELTLDGKTMATSSGSEGLKSHDTEIKLWDLGAGKSTRTLKADKSTVQALALTQDDNWLASGGTEGKVHLWDAKKGSRRLLETHPQPVSGIALSRDGKLIASGSNRAVLLSDAETGRRLLGWETGSDVLGLVFGPDGKRLVVAGGNSVLKAWDTATGKELFNVRTEMSFNTSLVLSEDGRLLAHAENDFRPWNDAVVRVRKAATGEVVWTISKLADSPARFATRYFRRNRRGRGKRQPQHLTHNLRDL